MVVRTVLGQHRLLPVFWCGAFGGIRTAFERLANGQRTGHSGFSTRAAARLDGHSVRSDWLRTASERPCERCPRVLVLGAFYCITSGRENWPSGRSLFTCTLLFHEAAVRSSERRENMNK
jgi:hypothetical protein